MSVTLVTGATGLVGNNVVRALLDQGQSVRVLVRETSDPRPMQGLDVERVTGDIRDAASVDRACRGVESVIHSAGYVQIGRSQLRRHRQINVEGTRHVARAALAAGARMVHVSSCDALGIVSSTVPADEETVHRMPVPAPYAVTKCEAEQVIQELIGKGLDATIVNPGFMLGPWDWKPSSGRMLLEVAQGKGWFAPRGYFSLCDVRDVVGGILAARERGAVGRRYALAGVTMTYLEAWRLFANVTGARRPLGEAGPVVLALAGWCGDLWTHLTRREPDVNSYAIRMAALPKHYSIARAQSELGYQLRPLDVTVEQTWAWFQEHRFV